MMSAEDLSHRAAAEQAEAKREERDRAMESMAFTTDLMSDMWLRMWTKLTQATTVPDEIAKGWMDCWIHHSLVSSHNSAMAEKVHGFMVHAQKIKNGGDPEYPDKEF